MSDVEELGEDKCYPRGAGDQEDGVESGEVRVAAAVWAIDQGSVHLLGCYGILLRAW